MPSAPIAPPIVWPKRRGDNPSSRTRRSTWARKRQQRTAVAAACGNVTSATAVVVPNLRASNGVIMLPIPNPTTVAVAPERIATMNTATRNTGRFYRRQVGDTPDHSVLGVAVRVGRTIDRSRRLPRVANGSTGCQARISRTRWCIPPSMGTVRRAARSPHRPIVLLEGPTPAQRRWWVHHASASLFMIRFLERGWL